MKIGDKVRMNSKYRVSEENKKKIFTVRSEEFEISGTKCVLLEGRAGGYAVDGLDLVQVKSCLYCDYCQYPRTSNDNAGQCKCKAMKRKTIDVYVCAGETPDWCPLR